MDNIAHIRPRTYAPLIALCLGFFMVIIDVTIVNVALPSMQASLNTNVSGLQWIVDGYTLTFACLLLTAGNLGDRFGAKSAYLSGLLLFIAASFGCGLSNTFILLTLYRLLQGVGAALLVPTSLALINASYENKEDKAKAIGIWAAVGGIAAASGPLLGAALTATFGWRAVFFVNIPVGIIGILLTIYFIKHSFKAEKHSFDLLGQIFAIISIAALAFGLIEVGRLGWTSELVITSFILFLVTFTLFLFIEHKTSSPMFPLTLFHSKTFSTAIIVGMILNIGFYGELFVLPLYFQHIREYSVLMTGLAILPLPGFVALASYLAGKMASMTGPKLPMISGLIIGGVGFLSLLIVEQEAPSYLLLILPLAAIGFGTAFTMPAATIAVIHSSPKDKAGIASGALSKPTGR